MRKKAGKTMTLQVNDVMGTVAIAVHREATFAELTETMRRFKVGNVAVIDADGRPVGVVSQDDLLPEGTTSRGRNTPEARRERQRCGRTVEMIAGEIMTSPALTVTRQTSIPEAVRLMHANRVEQLPVVDAVSGKIAGTLHQVDLLRAFDRRPVDS
ncbi:CBS domain-containing protein [Streptosporangium sp. NBC_01756]|uniref:CBS domain-containing protein n=1 Tax=Streptosporangium sp. NBC_01756 TaxID=2975950 RepID=UPI002DDAF049|nr:CBS domain-containing protein [Streptosporangium sp. NBC_01756]WSC86148.1 CBS domain-containing protein [Streptosporangium sp. NBC_01756]